MRKRNQSTKDLPEFLYEKMAQGALYYQYKRPDDGKYVGAGRNKDDAISAANELNNIFLCGKGRPVLSKAVMVSRMIEHAKLGVDHISPLAMRMVKEYYSECFSASKPKKEKTESGLDGYGATVQAAHIRKLSKQLFNRCKRNSKQRCVDIFLTENDVMDLVLQSNLRCAVSGIRLQLQVEGYGIGNPWSISIDRINSSQPYSVENCRIVCLAANIAMGSWGFEVLKTLSTEVVNYGR